MRQRLLSVSGESLTGCRHRAELDIIDLRTDAAIQRSLREELGGDVTVLTVAHRLQTIMDYDKIVRFLLCSDLIPH